MRRPSTRLTACLGLVLGTAVVPVLGGCRSDGRTLRPAGPRQTASISVPTTPTVPADPGTADPSLDAANADAGATVDLGGTDIPAATVIGPWAANGPIPATYTCDGADTSPALTWTDAPAGTVEIAITVTDEQAPEFVHWVVGRIPAAARSINEHAVPAGAIQGITASGVAGYRGPCPPAGQTHTYHYTIHFLGQKLPITAGQDNITLLGSITDLELDSAELVGTYTRPAGARGGSDTVSSLDLASIGTGD